MKKIVFILVVLISAISIVYWINGQYKNNSTGGSFTNNRSQCQIATTSAIHITAGAASSTCIVVDMTDAKSADLRFAVVASTTATILNYDYSASQDDAGSSRNWFNIKDSATSWQPNNSVASTTYRSIPIFNLSANYLKVDYTLTGDNGAVYLEVIRRNEIK